MIKFGANDKSTKKGLKGLVDAGKITVNCADCGQSLMVFQLIQSQTQVLTRVLVECGFCNGHSHVQQLIGQFYPGAADDNIIFDIIENDSIIECDTCFRAWLKG